MNYTALKNKETQNKKHRLRIRPWTKNFEPLEVAQLHFAHPGP